MIKIHSHAFVFEILNVKYVCRYYIYPQISYDKIVGYLQVSPFIKDYVGACSLKQTWASAPRSGRRDSR